jgi:hypothetical protein
MALAEKAAQGGGGEHAAGVKEGRDRRGAQARGEIIGNDSRDPRQEHSQSPAMPFSREAR